MYGRAAQRALFLAEEIQELMLQVEEGPFSLRDVAPGKLPCWRIAQTHAHSGSTDWICDFKNEYIELGRIHG